MAASKTSHVRTSSAPGTSRTRKPKVSDGSIEAGDDNAFRYRRKTQPAKKTRPAPGGLWGSDDNRSSDAPCGEWSIATTSESPVKPCLGVTLWGLQHRCFNPLGLAFAGSETLRSPSRRTAPGASAPSEAPARAEKEESAVEWIASKIATGTTLFADQTQPGMIWRVFRGVRLKRSIPTG
jgi:hypothetical protein